MTTVATGTTTITTPGVYDMPADVYLADPVPGGSLSSSGVKLLLPPSCPAIFAYRRVAGEEHKDAFDFGHAAHTEVLGAGRPTVVVDAETWQTKAAKEAKAAAHAKGYTPLLAKDAATVKAMAAQLRRHPIASALLDPEYGNPEQAVFAQDRTSGVWLRGMYDWLPNPSGGRLIISDYKTTVDNGNPETFDRTMATRSYHAQAAWYLDLARTVGLDDDPAFVFIVQSKNPPYLVSVIEPDRDAIRIGRQENRSAIELFARCTETGVWPGFGDDVTLASLPPWYITRTPKDYS
jgi:hypothetical protein